MNICFSLSNLEAGGAQTFVLRLAAGMAEKGHRVCIYDHGPETRNKSMRALLPSSVKVFSYAEGGLRRFFVWKLNGLFIRLKLHNAFRQHLNKKAFQRTLKKQQVEILNSHMSFSDFVVAETELPAVCRFIPTLHGEYELLLSQKGMEEHFIQKIKAVIRKADAVIYTADKNLSGLKNVAPLPDIFKVAVGFDPAWVVSTGTLSRKDLGIDEGDFVIGMVGRGIPEKGWETAIRAVQESRQKQQNSEIVLLLVGDGDYLKELHHNTRDQAIKLLTFKTNYKEYFLCYGLLDLFIFPSEFAGESMPNVVIEALSQNVPVLATNVAEIPSMLAAGTDKAAGICLGPGPDLDKRMSAEIRALYSDRDKLKTLRDNCSSAFNAFNMEKVLNRYLEIFERVRQK